MRARVVLAALAVAAAAPAADPELEEMGRRGQARLEEFQYEAALDAFAAVIEGYRQGRLDPSEEGDRALLASAFEGRAVAHLGAGDMDAVREALREGIASDPGFSPDRQRRSPRLLEIFDEIRERTVGRITVRTEPPGAAVRLDDRVVGRSPLDEVAWHAGPVRVALDLPGHEPVAAEVDLPAGETVTVERALTPDARTVIARTSPPGAAIFVDGKPIATSRGPAEEAIAARHGVPAERLSREVVLEHLSPGVHRVRVERPCHETLETSLEVEVDPVDNEPLRLAPWILHPSVARLEVHSRPTGARVLVDGEDAGIAPLTLPAVCAGRRVVELAGEERGRWAGEVELLAGTERSLHVTLLPTLVFAGVRRGEGGGDEAAREAEALIGETLQAMRRYHVLRVAEGAAAPPDRELEAVLEEHEADLLIAAEVREDRVRPVIEVSMRSRSLPGAESFVVSTPDELPGRLEALGSSPRIRRPWLGLTAVDTTLHREPTVIRLHPGGPAELAGVLLGDRLAALDGREVSSIASIHGILQAVTTPDDVSLTVIRAGREHVLSVPLGSTPVVEVTAGGGDRKLLVDLDYVAAAAGDEDGRAVAQLGRALAFLRMDRPDLALRDALAGVELVAGRGISAGTVAYVRGLCYERLGPEYREDARRAFQEAAGSEGATLLDHDGPAVAPLARLHLEELR